MSDKDTNKPLNNCSGTQNEQLIVILSFPSASKQIKDQKRLCHLKTAARYKMGHRMLEPVEGNFYVRFLGEKGREFPVFMQQVQPSFSFSIFHTSLQFQFFCLFESLKSIGFYIMILKISEVIIPLIY